MDIVFNRRVLLRVSGEEEMEHLSRESSLKSFHTGDLPSLGDKGNRKLKQRKRILSPHDPYYRIWQNFLVLLVLYTAWVSPFEFGFLTRPEAPLSYIDNVVNGFFAVDIILTFCVAYFDKTTYLLVDEPKRIAWKYVSSWFGFDVISTIPAELYRLILPPPLQSYCLFSMLRLWRLRRVSAFFSRLEKDRNYNYFCVWCIKLLCVIIFWVHSAGCCFYLIAARYPNPEHTWIGALMGEDFPKENLWARYITSVYWSMVTMTTVGYGDIHPVNTREMFFNVIYIIFNMGLYSYLIGNMTNLVVHGTSRTRKFRDAIQAASNFAQRNHLPTRLQDQMLAHLCLKFRTDAEGLQQQESLDALPKAIRSSISHFLFYSILDKVYLFRGVSNDLLFQLVSEMEAEYFPPKEDVILHNEAPTDFYILVTGVMELLHYKDGVEQVFRELHTGDICGEIGVLCYKPQHFTVRTKHLCQLLRMNRTKFLGIVQANVGDGTLIMDNLLQHLKEQNDPIMKKVMSETENMVAHGAVDLPLSLCFAALREDDSLLQKLLKRGLDPNEPNTTGRTALQIAVSKGSEKCVRLLLNFGADPNCKGIFLPISESMIDNKKIFVTDSTVKYEAFLLVSKTNFDVYADPDGNVPLWEAIIGGNEQMIKLLMENGASLVAGDAGHFACTAAEQNSLKLLKEIVRYGGDVISPKANGMTSLHVAVSEDNIDIVKFLLDQGADIDKPDIHGWTPRHLAEQQGHEEIQTLFQSIKESKSQSDVTIPERRQGSCFLGRFTSEPVITPPRVGALMEGSSSKRRRRSQANIFHNSLFGIMSASHNVKKDPSLSNDIKKHTGNTEGYKMRVIISCPEKGDISDKLMLLPGSYEELVEIGYKKFCISQAKVFSKDGAEIDDIEVIRDGDHLNFVSVNQDLEGCS